jgi:hypothetical protein
VLASRNQAQRKLWISVIVPVGCGVLIGLFSYLFWRYQMAPISRQLIGASKGTAASQKDLPYELRRRFEAVKVLGSGSYGVVVEAWHISNGKRTIRRAIKLVHARHSIFEDKDLRRLNREVCFKRHYCSITLWSSLIDVSILEFMKPLKVFLTMLLLSWFGLFYLGHNFGRLDSSEQPKHSSVP